MGDEERAGERGPGHHLPGADGKAWDRGARPEGPSANGDLLGPGLVRRALAFRVPMWVLLAAVVVVAGALAVFAAMRLNDAVHLGPAVGGARRVEVHIELCNRDVDRLKINPRASELTLEKVLRDRGAKAADVVVDRSDCPTVTAPSAP